MARTHAQNEREQRCQGDIYMYMNLEYQQKQNIWVKFSLGPW